MLDAKDLQAIASLLKPQFDMINSRLDKIEVRLETIEQDVLETKTTVNELGEWADTVATVTKVPYMLDAQ